MNIIIGLFVIISALVLKHFYKVKSEASGRIFKVCILVGVFMFFSVQTFGNALLIAMTVAEILLCAALLAVYRAQLIRDRAEIRRKRAMRRQRAAAAAANTEAQRTRRVRVVPNAA